MHLEFLVEDRSGARLLDCIVPRILGPAGQPHTWRVNCASVNVLFRLAIEEVEAWYFGDRQALLQTFPRAKSTVIGKYD